MLKFWRQNSNKWIGLDTYFWRENSNKKTDPKYLFGAKIQINKLVSTPILARKFK